MRFDSAWGYKNRSLSCGLFLFIPQSAEPTAPGGMPSLPSVVPGDLFAFPYFAGKIPGPVARLMAQSLRSELSPSHFVTAPGGMPSLPSVVPGDLSVFYGQNTRISRESRLLNILNRRIFLQRNTYLSVKVALFPDGMLKLVGLSGEMADFPDESHNLR